MKDEWCGQNLLVKFHPISADCNPISTEHYEGFRCCWFDQRAIAPAIRSNSGNTPPTIEANSLSRSLLSLAHLFREAVQSALFRQDTHPVGQNRDKYCDRLSA